MSTKEEIGFSWSIFNKMPIMGIVRGICLEDFQKIIPVYVKSGLTTLEVTMNTPNVEHLIKFAVKEYSGIINVGAGTVCSLEDLDVAIDLGAQFIVTPLINEEVIITCVGRNVPIFPGALTPSEIYCAWRLGAEIVKVFPASNLGAGYIQDILGPLEKVRLLPTGGINLNNMESFLKIGVAGFGVGSPLFDKSLIAAKDWEGLGRHFACYVKLIEDFRSA
ncbi:MAG: bifunctional 4-hydroxy-2-oxoglutarate aldolase/2-dehydro-3-deoxy-phosphogluconate aldolase [Prolixibacteraceae bacterium]|jgi:2-dehydro-3-deoxyphosphogluconate aldolase/(4S)-4-hydroxy-2-oxoglutarate aldolase|nr:bifunctional 4-hydroxy-2-oxoglutarate aldolase/2-dehydro-3-deoxy-phosphogluconate aldolase [Prolixibacteraceae bacterium]